MVHPRILNTVPLLYGRIALFIHPMCTSLHLLIPNSQSFPPHPPLPATCLSSGSWINWLLRSILASKTQCVCFLAKKGIYCDFLHGFRVMRLFFSLEWRRNDTTLIDDLLESHSLPAPRYSCQLDRPVWVIFISLCSKWCQVIIFFID